MIENIILQLCSVRDWVRYCISETTRHKVYFGHGFANAYDEAVFLVASSLTLPLDHITEFWDAQLLMHEREALSDVIAKRCARVPAAFIVEQAWLGGVCFRCDSRALVPRSLIAEVLEHGLDSWLPRPPATVLDLCTGGGSLAVLVALCFPEAQIVASDISKDALSLAQENVELHGLNARIELIQSDLFESLNGARFDLILCNPPYVKTSTMQTLYDEYRYEPELALHGGEDGMRIVKKLISDLGNHLTEEGIAVIEIGHEYESFAQCFPQLDMIGLSCSLGDHHLMLLTRSVLVNYASKLT